MGAGSEQRSVQLGAGVLAGDPVAALEFVDFADDALDSVQLVVLAEGELATEAVLKKGEVGWFPTDPEVVKVDFANISYADDLARLHVFRNALHLRANVGAVVEGLRARGVCLSAGGPKQKSPLVIPKVGRGISRDLATLRGGLRVGDQTFDDDHKNHSNCWRVSRCVSVDEKRDYGVKYQ